MRFAISYQLNICLFFFLEKDLAGFDIMKILPPKISCNHFPYAIKTKEKFTNGRKREKAGQLIRRTKRFPSKDQALGWLCNHQFEHLQSSPLSRELNSANLIQLYWKSSYNKGQTGLSQVQFSLPRCFVLSVLWSGMCLGFFTFLKKQIAQDSTNIFYCCD